MSLRSWVVVVALVGCGGGGDPVDAPTVADVPVALDSPAAFDVPDASTRTVTLVVVGEGTLTAGAATCPTDCAVEVADGGTLVVTASPASMAVVDGWDGPCADARGTCSLTVTSDLTLTVTFASGWSCDPDHFGDDTCDCGCGVFDRLDCVDRTVAACEVCDAAGSCGTAACPAEIDALDNASCL